MYNFFNKTKYIYVHTHIHTYMYKNFSSLAASQNKALFKSYYARHKYRLWLHKSIKSIAWI